MKGFQESVRPVLIYVGFLSVTAGMFLRIVPVDWYLGIVSGMFGYWFQERSNKKASE